MDTSDLDLSELFLDHIQASHAALDAAKSELEKAAAADREVADLVGPAVEALVRHQRIDPALREKCAAALRNPAEALKILIKAADPGVTTRPAAIGAPAPTQVKQAAAGSVVVGARVPLGDRESDRLLARAFGFGG